MSSTNSSPRHKIGKYYSDGVVIGRGQYGIVYKGWNSQTSEPVAIKEVDYDKITRKHQKYKDQLQSEINLMKAVKQENIARLYDVVPMLMGKTTFIYLVMEYCSEGDMLKYLQNQPNHRLTETKARYFMRQLGR
jgi:serine/threonine protein kinase